MANTGKLLAQAVLSDVATPTTVYTVPVSTTTVFSKVSVLNIDTATRKLTLHAGPAQGDANLLAKDTDILSGESIEVGRGLFLNAADVIQAFGSVAAKLVITVSGVEIV